MAIWGAFGGVPISRTIVFLVFILGSPPSGETTISGVGFKKGVDDPGSSSYRIPENRLNIPFLHFLV